MKTILTRLVSTVLLLGALAAPGSAQTYSTITTLSAAVTSASATQVQLTSATGVTAGTTVIWVNAEAMPVLGLTGTVARVLRGGLGTAAGLHASGASVIVAHPTTLISFDPVGACTASNYQRLPLINTVNGNVWLCRSSTWKATNIRPVTVNSFLTTP